MSQKLTATQNPEQECWQQFCLWMLKPGWEQPGCPFSGWWMTRLAHPGNGILFPDEERWTISHKKTRNLKCIQLSERSLSKMGTCRATAAIWHPGKRQAVDTVERSLGAGVKRRGKGEDFRSVTLSVWYCNGGFMTWCFCQTRWTEM